MKRLIGILLVCSLLLFGQLSTYPPAGGGTDEAAVGEIVQSATPVVAVDAGSTDAYAVTLDPVPDVVTDLTYLIFTPNTNNTGASTLDVGPGAALPIYQNTDGIDPDDGDLIADIPIVLTFCPTCNSSAGAWIYEGLPGVNNSIVVDDACGANNVPQLDGAGKIPNACLSTATQELIWIVPQALIAVGDLWPLHLPNYQAGTITAVFCIAGGAGSQTVSVNFDARDRTVPGTPGTDLETSEFTADANGIADVSFAGDTNVAENEDLWGTISALANTPTSLRCSVSVEAQ